MSCCFNYQKFMKYPLFSKTWYNPKDHYRRKSGFNALQTFWLNIVLFLFDVNQKLIINNGPWHDLETANNLTSSLICSLIWFLGLKEDYTIFCTTIKSAQLLETYHKDSNSEDNFLFFETTGSDLIWLLSKGGNKQKRLNSK